MGLRAGSPVALRLRIGVVAVLLVVCLAVAGRLIARDHGAERRAADAAQPFSPPALATPQTALVSVIADQLAGAEPGTDVAATSPSWISIVPQRVRVRLSPFIYPGSGYTIRGVGNDANGSTFVTRADRISASTKAVVFKRGAADQGRSRVVGAKAAEQALAWANAG